MTKNWKHTSWTAVAQQLHSSCTPVAQQLLRSKKTTPSSSSCSGVTTAEWLHPPCSGVTTSSLHRSDYILLEHDDDDGFFVAPERLLCNCCATVVQLLCNCCITVVQLVCNCCANGVCLLQLLCVFATVVFVATNQQAWAVRDIPTTEYVENKTNFNIFTHFYYK